MPGEEDPTVPSGSTTPHAVSIAGRGLLVVVAAALVALVFARALDAELDRDESMYLTAGALADDHALYEDLPFLQMPYAAWILSPLLDDATSRSVLRTGRVFTASVATVCLGLLVVLSMRFGAGAGRGLALAVLLALQPAFAFVAAHASNHLLPVSFALAALVVATTCGPRRPPWRAAVVGLLVGLAVGTRLTWAIVAIGALAAAMIDPRSRHRSLLGPAVLGFAVALVPVVVAWVQAPQEFLFQNLGYHALNRAWATGVEPFDTGRGAFLRWLRAETTDPALPAAMAVALVALGLRLRAGIGGWPRALAFGVLCLGVGLATVAPSPWWPQHAAIFLVGLAVATVVFTARIEHRLFDSLLLVAALLAAVGPLRYEAAVVGRLFDPETWRTSRFEHTVAPLSDVDPGGPVTTLSPLHVLEAGLPVDPRSTSGPFLVRVRDLMDPVQERHDAGGSDLLEITPRVTAFLSGVEPRFEGDVEERLERAGFEVRARTEEGAVLWVRPAGVAGR